MDLNIQDDKPRRKSMNFTLDPRTIDKLREVAELYDSNMSRTLDALILKFAPPIIEHRKAQLNGKAGEKR